MVEQHYNLRTLSKLLDIPQAELRRACKDGELEFFLTGKTITVPESAIQPFGKGQKPRQVILLERRIEALEEENDRLQEVLRQIASLSIREV